VQRRARAEELAVALAGVAGEAGDLVRVAARPLLRVLLGEGARLPVDVLQAGGALVRRRQRLNASDRGDGDAEGRFVRVVALDLDGGVLERRHRRREDHLDLGGRSHREREGRRRTLEREGGGRARQERVGENLDRVVLAVVEDRERPGDLLARVGRQVQHGGCGADVLRLEARGHARGDEGVPVERRVDRVEEVRARVAGQRRVGLDLLEAREAVAVRVQEDGGVDRGRDRLPEVELLLDGRPERIARAGPLPAVVADPAGMQAVALLEAELLREGIEVGGPGRDRLRRRGEQQQRQGQPSHG
jgi:hypothetical protein